MIHEKNKIQEQIVIIVFIFSNLSLKQVGLIILYDHVHPVGAFVKNSAIDVSIENLSSVWSFILGVNFLCPVILHVFQHEQKFKSKGSMARVVNVVIG